MGDERLSRLRRNAKYIANEPQEQQELNNLLAGEVDIVRSVEPAGWQNLVLEVEGEKIPFHRLHNPFDEWADKMLASDSPEILICCGSGFGYQLPGLLARAERAKKIVVVETRVEPLLVFLTELELENFLSDEVEILYAPEPERLAGFLKKQFHRYHPTLLKFLPLESFGLLEPGYVEAVVQDIQDAWNRHLIYLKSMEEQHTELIRNTKLNLQSVHESHRLKKGSARGRRVAILASGPSLDYNLPLLSALGEYVHLLAVGSALVPVQECGVEPDMVIVSDPQQVNAAHFPDDEYNLQLAFDPVIPNSIVRKFRGDKLVYNIGHGIVELLESKFGLTRLRGWGTVSSSALALAAEAGFDEILLVGTDFSFFDKIVHTESYLLQSATEDYRVAVDAVGKEVRTTETLNDYADYLNGQIRSLTESGHKIFNCCEGGLLTEGIRISLREYYSRMIRQGVRKEPWHWKEPIRIARDAYRELIADLEGMLEAADEAIDATARGEITTSELMSMTIVSAFEGGMLPEAHALEKALIDGDRDRIERSREATRTALRAGVRELVETLEEFEKESRQR